MASSVTVVTSLLMQGKLLCGRGSEGRAAAAERKKEGPGSCAHSNSLANPEIPPDKCPLRYVSVTPAELIDLTPVYVLTSTRSAALHICSVPAPAVRNPLEQLRRTYISGRCRSTTHQFC